MSDGVEAFWTNSVGWSARPSWTRFPNSRCKERTTRRTFCNDTPFRRNAATVKISSTHLLFLQFDDVFDTEAGSELKYIHRSGRTLK